MVKKYPHQRWPDKKKKKKGNSNRVQTHDSSWKKSSVQDLKSKPKGWMVWGYKPKIIKGEKHAVEGRQLGNASTLKSVASDEAETWRTRGYIVEVQPTFREPKYP